ncbi:MAG: hypothetical protein A2X61_01490 [Ignavibacteria bacterium GWB2_35_12]|nr:MAG: hypothetical protein A2X63_05585 [Ignavibacteria bacterium GWA2_35_8]OGU41846.1 MAG: hypothetical protein A2X61_01490 [Ignavibacteria bacterium GWB2_35_12]OGU86070.1 MAG: hypothetical protein A2220_04810 [Ignavibacteria bacterium RIFOXYA2_FULL_35_10]OGV23506.1 MAG: hypothetical protein A2475_06155 [Ignavibacteria bacterium RIFOXYC2_FULL_35_21]
MDEYDETYSAEGDSGVEVKSKKGWLYISLLIVVIFVSGVVYLSNSYAVPQKLTNIIITGNFAVSTNEIINKINFDKIEKAGNLKTLAELKKQIEKNPYIDYSYVYQKNSSEIVVEIHEKKPVAILIDDNYNNYFISKDASILPYKLIHLKNDYPIIRGINVSGNRNSKIVKSALELITLIDNDESQELSKAISEVVYNPIARNFKVILSESGKEILIGSSSEAENKSEKLRVVLQNLVHEQDLADAELIDLRWKNQIVVKNKMAYVMPNDTIKKTI